MQARIRTAAAALCAWALLGAGAVLAQPGPPTPPSVLTQAQVAIGDVVALPDIVYARPGGFRPLKLDLYKPKAATGPLPVVVWIHGGGWGGGDPRGGIFAGQDWPATAAELAGRGYVVASISYRLSGEAQFPAQAQDVRAAVRWLRAHAAEHGIDPAHVLMTGGSAGGYLAALAGVSCGDASLDTPPAPAAPGRPAATPPPARSECVQAVVLFYPVTDLPTLGKAPAAAGPPSDSAESPIGRFLGCALAQCGAAKIAAADVLGRVDASDPPFLIFHGDADTTVPISQSRALDAALKAKGVASELVVIPGAVHVFPNLAPEVRRDILDRTWRFLDAHSGKAK